MTKQPTQKECTKCGIVKPLAFFHKNKRGKYGRHAACRACTQAYKARHNAKLRIYGPQGSTTQTT